MTESKKGRVYKMFGSLLELIAIWPRADKLLEKVEYSWYVFSSIRPLFV